jgi:hypothetical protein
MNGHANQHHDWTRKGFTLRSLSIIGKDHVNDDMEYGRKGHFVVDISMMVDMIDMMR